MGYAHLYLEVFFFFFLNIVILLQTLKVAKRQGQDCTSPFGFSTIVLTTGQLTLYGKELSTVGEMFGKGLE